MVFIVIPQNRQSYIHFLEFFTYVNDSEKLFWNISQLYFKIQVIMLYFVEEPG